MKFLGSSGSGNQTRSIKYIYIVANSMPTRDL